MDIFRCLPQADLFIRAYEKEFASRLISKSSANDDLEEFFITTLKNECGEPLTKRLVDLKRNYEQKDKQFQNALARAQAKIEQGPLPKCFDTSEIEFTVEVLGSDIWPAMKAQPCALPKFLTDRQSLFQQWYLDSESNASRKLNFQNSYGSFELQCINSSKTVILEVNTYQAAILLLFNNDCDKLTCLELLKQTDMSVDNFRLAMGKLCDPKLKLFKYSNKKPVFKDDDSVEFNKQFKPKHKKLSLMPKKIVKKKASPEENKDEQLRNKALAKERNLVIQSQIVKEMKTNKTLKRSELLSKVKTRITNFEARVDMINEQIEMLKQQEYLEDDPEDTTILVYKA